MTIALLAVALFLAYSNGANDNIKGVATLVGCGTAGYRSALVLATAATLAGALCSLALARGLLKAFSGKGLVPDAVAASEPFLLAVALGAGLTVFLATQLGFPVSTTHALIGALTGTGALAAGAALDLGRLGAAFLAPLVLGPLLAISLTVPVYSLFHGVRTRLGLGSESCLCIGEAEVVPLALTGGTATLAARSAGLGLRASLGAASGCRQPYPGRVLGLPLQNLLDAGHFASAAVVSFARGLNDTPKIVGFLLVTQLEPRGGMAVVAAVAVCMAFGGLLHARKVAKRMSFDIAAMNDGQAFSANLVTGLVVIAASRLGLPVSTTHVSVGAITGVGLVNGSAARGALSSILASWVLTLPMAALFGALTYLLLETS